MCPTRAPSSHSARPASTEKERSSFDRRAEQWAIALEAVQWPKGSQVRSLTPVSPGVPATALTSIPIGAKLEAIVASDCPCRLSVCTLVLPFFAPNMLLRLPVC